MFNDVTLEMSLKPFKRVDDEYIQDICTKVFEQWRPLLKGREVISVMLWVGDGSELLDYTGDLEDEFEWARFLGTANLPYLEEGAPLETSLHNRKQDYIPNAPVMTYGILKKIISCIRKTGEMAFPNAKIRVGETFDIGPEFAISDFRYNRHRECISSSSGCDGYGFVDVASVLHGDSRRYAAYPEGIPEGTPFVTFFGKQTKAFFDDVGFDYMWLSNGLGFSSDPWKKTGKIFDGERYYPEKLAQTKAKVFDFWKAFCEACPNVPLETRGTNNSVGIDYASDCVPLYDIYKSGFDIVAPPNSPWAAINDNFGLEIMGHMTRICELPNGKFPFRYYLHDPWWLNSPWYDRYDGSPCDIYLPMAISRIDENGEIQAANKLNLLSIDNSYGGLPDACVNEPLPHLLKAEKDSPTEPAPLVWVYPMREYTTTESDDLLREMHEGDSFICDAINDGLPLCCVTSTDSFLKHNATLYNKSIIISPVPTNGAVLKKLVEMRAENVGVIVYGTSDMLSRCDLPESFDKIDIQGGAWLIREQLKKYGYCFDFVKRDETAKPPTLAVSRCDNAHWISAYNANTTTVARMKFPQGAPVLCGMEAEIVDGCSEYRFARGEHRECRAFVEQTDGVISCREAPPKSTRFRRAIRICGLKNATVRLFSETGCECAVTTIKTSYTPIFDDRFDYVYDEALGWYMEGKNIDGDIYFLIGHRNTEKHDKEIVL